MSEIIWIAFVIVLVILMKVILRYCMHDDF